MVKTPEMRSDSRYPFLFFGNGAIRILAPLCAMDAPRCTDSGKMTECERGSCFNLDEAGIERCELPADETTPDVLRIETKNFADALK